MYILEIFIKWLNKRQKKDVIYKKTTFEEVAEANFCEHNFMPIDSSGLILACTKCGFIVKKK